MGSRRTASMNNPRVSVVVACRNERSSIDRLVRSVLQMDAPDAGFELILADGASDDGTREILARLERELGERITVIENPRRIVSTGLNAAIRVARGQLIIRLDAHAQYGRDYLVQCVRVHDQTGAMNVGGPWRAVGRGVVGRGIAVTFGSRFATGGGRAHRESYEGPVDTVYLGCWDRADLFRLGLFDEELVRNQDDELNLRTVKSGGVIWQSPAIVSEYECRRSLRALAHQYYQYGFWKVRVIQKHRRAASWRHLVPAAALSAGVTLGAAALLSPLARLVFVASAAVYLSALVLVSGWLAAGTEWRLFPAILACFPCYHLSYAIGFLHGIWRFVILRSGPGAASVTLSRTE